MCQKEPGADWLRALPASAGSSAGCSTSSASGFASAGWMMMGADADVGLVAAVASGAGSSFTCTSV